MLRDERSEPLPSPALRLPSPFHRFVIGFIVDCCYERFIRRRYARAFMPRKGGRMKKSSEKMGEQWRGEEERQLPNNLISTPHNVWLEWSLVTVACLHCSPCLLHLLPKFNPASPFLLPKMSGIQTVLWKGNEGEGEGGREGRVREGIRFPDSWFYLKVPPPRLRGEEEGVSSSCLLQAESCLSCQRQGHAIVCLSPPPTHHHPPTVCLLSTMSKCLSVCLPLSHLSRRGEAKSERERKEEKEEIEEGGVGRVERMQASHLIVG